MRRRWKERESNRALAEDKLPSDLHALLAVRLADERAAVVVADLLARITSRGFQPGDDPA